MAVLTATAFLSKWTAQLPSTGNREITAARMREFAEDIKDSFQSVLGATAISSWKDPCVVATTGNITLSGEQTIDGVLTSGSRVLVKNQSTPSQNGIYVSAAGAWSRASDADSDEELEGAAVGVNQGTTNKNTVWIQTTDNVTVGTSSIVWQQVGYTSTVEIVDDDTFDSASATTVPSSESVKAYVDAQVGEAGTSGHNTTAATAITNVSAITLNSETIYTKIGDIVTFSGKFNVTPTATGSTVFDITPPVASNFTTANKASGVVVGYDDGTDTSLTGAVAAHAANNTLRITFVAPNTDIWLICVSGHYIIES